jgi:sugar phosphate isomerase/epimerase
MRIGFLAEADVQKLDWAAANGFGSIAWNRFETSRAATETEWRPHAENFAAQAHTRNIRISAIGALYKNPLDPEQQEFARATFSRAIEVASHLEISTVCGFPGAVIELEKHPKGNNPIYKPFEQFIPRLVQFWEPIARRALDLGVRLGFEHCPMGAYHLPIMSYNMLSQPAMWERFFNALTLPNVGLEWDASHLLCQFIDPVQNIKTFGSRIFHVHGKDARIDRHLMSQYGICHPGVAEHRFPGFGDANWAEIIHALLRTGYDSDLNIEGWHDPVFRDHGTAPPTDIHLTGERKQSGNLEQAGLLLARRHLEQFVPVEEV